MSLKLNSSGGGSVTLQEPVTASDLTLNLPATLGGTGNSMVVTSDASGNVGIGTSSPGLYGITQRTLSISAPTSSYAFLQLQGGSGDSGGAIDFGNNTIRHAEIASLIGSALAFYTNATNSGNALTERMRIDSSGNLLVGTTTTQQGGRFSIANTVNNVCVGMYASGTGNTTGTYLNCGDDFAIRFRVYTNGNVQNANNSYGSTSDIKLKENIVDATPKLEKLNQVRIVNYNLKNEPNQKLLGVVAQELEQVFPGMVDETPDRDNDGNDLGTTTKSVKYSVFVPMLIKSIQELKAELDTVKAELAAMKGTA